MIAKTSQSHPTRIDRLSLNDSSGLIGMTFCPGKKYSSSLSGEWCRDLDRDLRAIHSFGAKALVSLMETDELASVQVPTSILGSRVEQSGMQWHHLPIRDVSVPDEVFEDLWSYSGLRLRDLLRHGHNIVIHCLGGLGRTGTIAARLLVESGET